MDILDKVRQWLLTFPKWDGGGLLFLDYTDGVPGGAGLFPQGQEILWQKENLLGERSARLRHRFMLYRVGSDPDGRDAAWLLELQNWVTGQDALGLAPRLGTDTRWRAEKGTLQKNDVPGSSLYGVMLTAEFTIYYEKEFDYGEN